MAQKKQILVRSILMLNGQKRILSVEERLTGEEDDIRSILLNVDDCAKRERRDYTF